MLLKKLSSYIIGLCFISLGLSCVDVIKFDSADSIDLLVVDGELTNAQTAQKLTLKKLSPYGKGPDLTVNNAEVILVSGNGETYPYSDKGDGLYEIPAGEIKPKEGELYHIEIVLNNGEEYSSIPEEMPPLFEVDSIYFALEETIKTSDLGIIISQKVINIYINTPIKKGNQSARFRWTTDDVFSFTEIKCGPMHAPQTCYFAKETNPQDIRVFNGEKLSVETIQSQLVASESFNPDYAYNFRHYFNVAQHSISQEAYEYWANIDLVSNQSGNIFDAPPAGIRGNMYKKSDPDQLVLGYFEVSSVDTARVFTLPIYFDPFRIIPRCPPGFNYLTEPFNFPFDCCNCSALQKKGAIERPAYWGK